MKIFKKYKKAFTLIEIIIAITIISMVLVSIIEVFLFSGLFSKKVDISRVMQENIKNFTDIIAEDVRNNGVSLTNTGSNLDTLKTGIGTEAEYYLATKGNSGNYTAITTNICNSTCILVRKKDGNIEELINSWITFENLSFNISGNGKDIPKVTMNFTVKPVLGKGLNKAQVKDAKVIIQTTFSERLYKYK